MMNDRTCSQQVFKRWAETTIRPELANLYDADGMIARELARCIGNRSCVPETAGNDRMSPPESDSREPLGDGSMSLKPAGMDIRLSGERLNSPLAARRGRASLAPTLFAAASALC
jgi:hypothetical protein